MTLFAEKCKILPCQTNVKFVALSLPLLAVTSRLVLSQLKLQALKMKRQQKLRKGSGKRVPE